MNIEMIGFDADDTLWYTEVHYLKAQEDLKQILSPWGKADQVSEVIDKMILSNLSDYGYGIKAFILSLIEAAIHVSQGELQAHQVMQILSIGKRMLAEEIVLKPHVQQTLQRLVGLYPLMIITKLEQYDYTGATAIAVVMLLISFVLLLIINLLQAWTARRTGRNR